MHERPSVIATRWLLSTRRRSLGLAASLPRCGRFTARGRVRASLQPHIKELQEYGQGRGAKSFYCVLGPKAAGKSSTIHAAFGGWHGVYQYKVNLNVADHMEVNYVKQALAGPLGLEVVRNPPLRHEQAVQHRDFVAVLNLVNKQGELSDEEVSLLAAMTSALGRNLTRMFPPDPPGGIEDQAPKKKEKDTTEQRKKTAK